MDFSDSQRDYIIETFADRKVQDMEVAEMEQIIHDQYVGNYEGMDILDIKATIINEFGCAYWDELETEAKTK